MALFPGLVFQPKNNNDVQPTPNPKKQASLILKIRRVGAQLTSRHSPRDSASTCARHDSSRGTSVEIVIRTSFPPMLRWFADSPISVQVSGGSEPVDPDVAVLNRILRL